VDTSTGGQIKPRAKFVPYRLFSEVVTLPDLWDTVGMTNRQSRPQALEDRKIQKLVERLDQKLALQAKGAQIQGQAPTAPVPQQGSRLDQSRGFAYLGDRTIQVVPDP